MKYFDIFKYFILDTLQIFKNFYFTKDHKKKI